jgi:flavin-dependent dehydrogenase
MEYVGVDGEGAHLGVADPDGGMEVTARIVLSAETSGSIVPYGTELA